MKRRRVLVPVILAGLSAFLPKLALAWDPATTHAGLTAQALAASKFHATLAHQLGRALGSLEPLRLDMDTLDADSARSLKSRLEALDPAGGYRPSAEGTATASAWVLAGAVLSKTPPERGRHHFFDPRTGRGLDDGPGLSGMLHAARLTLDNGATVRDSATGLAFDLEGTPALDWQSSPRNDLGLTMFFDNWTLAASAPQRSQRETALVRALLALGGALAVLEDAGQPAFVRNDFRGEFLQDDSGSAFERFVSNRYGSVSLPPAMAAISRPSLVSYFVAEDGKGLAQATQRQFFSPGTLPQDFSFLPSQSPIELAGMANRSLRFPEPTVVTLDLRQSGITRYMVRDGVRVLAYQRNGDRVHFFLDQVVHQDMARRWLPEVEGYAAGMVDHLLRAKLQIEVTESSARVTFTGTTTAADVAAQVHIFSEDEAGIRSELATQTVQGGAPLSIDVPKGARKIAAYVRGQDGAGVYAAAAEARVP